MIRGRGGELGKEGRSPLQKKNGWYGGVFSRLMSRNSSLEKNVRKKGQMLPAKGFGGGRHKEVRLLPGKCVPLGGGTLGRRKKKKKT